jgi:hypothetical protein
VERQRVRYPDEEQLAVECGRKLREIGAPKAKRRAAPPQHYVRLLCNISMEADLPLREATWARIDAETDVEILQHLVALANIDNSELAFSRWREHLLETPRLWPLLAHGLLKKS